MQELIIISQHILLAYKNEKAYKYLPGELSGLPMLLNNLRANFGAFKSPLGLRNHGHTGVAIGWPEINKEDI